MVSPVSQRRPLRPCEEEEDTARPTVEYRPSIWGDYFIHLPPSFEQESVSWMKQRSEKLKDEVKRMLENSNDLLSKMCMVDAIQRLGLSYHFEEEVAGALVHIFEARVTSQDLHATALRFRLLRQEGYDVSTDEFKMFLDGDGNFTEILSGDVRGLLSLYEAAFLAKHGEVILDKAVNFCKHHLIKSKLDHVEEPEIGTHIAHTLEAPLHRRAKRLEARYYISNFAIFDGRYDQLLELAKLDFNLLMLLHQEEIRNVCEWWKELGLITKLTFARDRVVECYFWILGIYFEPCLSRARVMTTKVIALSSVLDDIYDAYGTLEELEPFTDALRRQDAGVISQLPEYMKIYLITLVETLKGFEDELAKEGHSYRLDFLKSEINDLAEAYLKEAKWRNEGYMPPFDVHLCTSLTSSGYRMLACAALIGMDEICTTEALNWVASFPKPIKAICTIARLMDDMVSYELEQEREHVASSIQCYMKEHGTTLEETCEKLQEKIEAAWKDINEESLHPTTTIPVPLHALVINLARMMVTLYKDHDEFTHPSKLTEDRITSLLTRPIPI